MSSFDDLYVCPTIEFQKSTSIIVVAEDLDSLKARVEGGGEGGPMGASFSIEWAFMRELHTILTIRLTHLWGLLVAMPITETCGRKGLNETRVCIISIPFKSS